jgi:hypothetical protein
MIRENELLKRRNEQLMKENLALKSRLAGSEADSLERSSSDYEPSTDDTLFDDNRLSPSDHSSYERQEEQLNALIEPVFGSDQQQQLIDLATVTSIETAELINVSLQKIQEETNAEKMSCRNRTNRTRLNQSHQSSTASTIACPLWIKQLICLFILAVKSATTCFDGSKPATNSCLTATLTNLCTQLPSHQIRQLLQVLTDRPKLQTLLLQLLHQPNLKSMLHTASSSNLLTNAMALDPMLSQAQIAHLDLDTFD